MISLLSAAMLAAPSSSLCVSMPADAKHGFDMPQLLAALRARIARRELRITPCRPKKTPTWRAELNTRSPTTLELTLSGPELDHHTEIDLSTTDDRHQRVQLIALTIAEAARPAVEIELGPSTDDRTDELLDRIAKEEPKEEEERPPDEVTVSEQPPPKPWRLGLLLAGGGKVGWPAEEPMPALAARAHALWNNWIVQLTVEWQHPPNARSTGMTLERDDVIMRAGIGHRWRPFDVELAAATRLSFVALEGDESVSDTFWSWGVCVTSTWWMFDADWLRVGMKLELDIWPQGNRFLVHGTRLASQSLLEVFAGPTMGVEVPW